MSTLCGRITAVGYILISPFQTLYSWVLYTYQLRRDTRHYYNSIISMLVETDIALILDDIRQEKRLLQA